MVLYTLYVVNKAGGLIYTKVCVCHTATVVRFAKAGSCSKASPLTCGVSVCWHRTLLLQLCARPAMPPCAWLPHFTASMQSLHRFVCMCVFLFGITQCLLTRRGDCPSTLQNQLAPVTNGGIEMLEAKTFVLQCYHTFTGPASPNPPNQPPSHTNPPQLCYCRVKVLCDCLTRQHWLVSLLKRSLHSVHRLRSQGAVCVKRLVLSSKLTLDDYTSEPILRTGDASAV